MRAILQSLTTAMILTALTTQPASAIDKCRVKVDGKTGVINVSAVGASGTILWGETADAADNSFFNAGNCLIGTVASGCQLADPSTIAAKTPPPSCTIYLNDGGEPCSAWIVGCTPGLRTASTPEWTTPPVPRFLDNGDGTITDRKTRLMWVRQLSGSFDVRDVTREFTLSADSAGNPDGTAYTELLTALNDEGLGGYGNWRLPTLSELAEIYTGAYTEHDAFGPIALNYYWSSTSFPDSTAEAWVVDFRDGSTVRASKTTSASVRAVRSLP